MIKSPPNFNVLGSKPAVFHYTDCFGLHGILSSKSIWCSKIQYLNDSEELTNGLKTLTDVCRLSFGDYPELTNMRESIERLSHINIFISSFCEDGDLLSQWRGYSGESGFSVGFSFERLDRLARQQGFGLVKCTYSQEAKNLAARDFIDDFIKKYPKREGEDSNDYSFRLASMFVPVAASFKHHSFSAEREWRLISDPKSVLDVRTKVRPTASLLIPYYEFNLSDGNFAQKSSGELDHTSEDIGIAGVIVGPSNAPRLQMDATSTLFSANKIDYGSIRFSETPYRTV